MDERLASMSPDELRSAMRGLGYRTQNELAHAIGVSRSAVSLWLEGKVGVPRPVAMLLRCSSRRSAAPTDVKPLDDQQQAARDWFETLRTRICEASRQSSATPQRRRFDYAPWDRDDAGGDAGEEAFAG